MEQMLGISFYIHNIGEYNLMIEIDREKSQTMQRSLLTG